MRVFVRGAETREKENNNAYIHLYNVPNLIARGARNKIGEYLRNLEISTNNLASFMYKFVFTIGLVRGRWLYVSCGVI